MEVIAFESEDVIITSCTTVDDDDIRTPEIEF